MGIEPSSVPTIGQPVATPSEDAPTVAVPAVAPSPVPRDVELPPAAPVEAAPADPLTAVPVPQDSALPVDSAPVAASNDGDMEHYMFLVSGYVEALKREFSQVEANAKDHARAVLAELRLVDEAAFNAFAATEPKVAAILGGNVTGTAAAPTK